MRNQTLERLSAFATDPNGGNPAGVWIGTVLPPPDEMLRIAGDVGYSETAFLAPSPERDHWTTRYFSPRIEIDFCGHATIASAVVLGRRHGHRTYHLDTNVGVVPVEVRAADDAITATLTSVEPRQRPLDGELLAAVLDATHWTPSDLDPDLVPGLAYAGAWHLVLPVRSRALLAALDYDFDTMGNLMTAHGLTTIQVIWHHDEHAFHSRNPFPVGGVVEDPATGAAAAALGGYLRHHGYVSTPADIVVTQGVDMGRPSRIDVHIPSTGGISVTGTAVPIPHTEQDEPTT